MIKNGFKVKWIPDCVWYHKDPCDFQKLFKRIRREHTVGVFKAEKDNFRLVMEMMDMVLENRDIVALGTVPITILLIGLFAKIGQ
jgi:hypothetical protein